MIKKYLPTEDGFVRVGQDDEQWNGNKPFNIDEDDGGKRYLIDNNDINKGFYKVERYNFKNGELRYVRELDYVSRGDLQLKDHIHIWVSDCLGLKYRFHIERITSNSVWVYHSNNDLIYTRSVEYPIIMKPTKEDRERIKYILQTEFKDCFAGNKIMEKVRELYKGEYYGD